MPELPEVETIARELRDKIIGEIFSSVKANWPGSFVVENGIQIGNNQIVAIARKGKYIIFQLQHGYLIIHLRMTGQLIVKDMLPDKANYLRVVFRLLSGRYLLFYDMRKFGRIYLCSNPGQVLKNVGIDALDQKFSTSYLQKILAERKTKIKPFLLEQRHLAGLGNIYIDESLHRARIHPLQQSASLTKKEVEKLYTSIKFTLVTAIKNMGTTVSDYQTTGGGFGNNQNYLKVYDREDQPCYSCKTHIIKIKVGGRGTHFCPSCQKLKSSEL